MVTVDRTAVERRPASVAQQLAFGVQGSSVHFTVRRGQATLDRDVQRGPAPEPAGAPKSPNIFVGIHPMVTWQGEFIPCMGAGPLGPAVIAGCLSHYRKDGFVPVSALGSTGLTFADTRSGGAVVSAVSPGSPAASADLQVGDEIAAIDGKPLTASRGQAAQALLFGKANTARHIVVDRHGRDIAVDLVLASM